MKIKTLFFTTILGSALLFSGLAGAGLAHKNTMEAVKAEGEPNATYSYIFSDDWNNTSYAAGFNKLLIVYTGTGHGYSEADEIINDAGTLSKVLLDGKELSSYSGSLLRAWKGQNFLYIVYPTSAVSEGSILQIKEGLTVGASIFNESPLLRLNNNSKWEGYFDEPVNSTCTGIYNDTWNNTETSAGSGLNKILITYTGVAHGNTAAVTSHALEQYNAYVSIDGAPLSSFSGSQIAPFTNQPWIQFIYPATAVSVGSRLVINTGCKIGNAVLGKVAFQLNSSSKWEKINLIEDDALVADSDYLLFTYSDYNLPGNDTNPCYGDIGSAALDSFGFQFNVNIPTDEIANCVTVIRLCATNIYGSNSIMNITIDYKSNTYITFNGAIDWSTSISLSWVGDVNHLIECYAIRTDSTHMICLFGIDGLLIWKTAAKDISAIDFTGHTFIQVANSGTTKQKSYYSAESSVEKALTRFNERKLHSKDVSFSNNNDTGNCLSYYGGAKTFYNTYLNSVQRKEFATSGTYANQRARLIAWGVANGESVSFNGSTGDLIVASNANMLSAIVEDKSALIIVVISSFVAVTALLYILVLKKRKQQ